MAQKVSIEIVDDIDGSVADETVSFALDGARYEIDLTTKNATALRDALAPFIAAGRRLDRSAASRAKRRASRNGDSEATIIRAWARENGVPVSERGRVGADVVAAYKAAR